MFVQHMLAVLRPDGMVATVMPHGVLFRGGAEGEIRTGFLERRPARGGHRPGPEPVLRHRHPRLHPGAARAGHQASRARRARCCSSTPTASSARAGRRTTCCPSTSRRSSPPTGPSPTSPASPRVVDPRRAGRERRQPQHPPLRRQRAAARAAGRPRPPARRRPDRRGRRCGPAARPSRRRRRRVLHRPRRRLRRLEPRHPDIRRSRSSARRDPTRRRPTRAAEPGSTSGGMRPHIRRCSPSPRPEHWSGFDPTSSTRSSRTFNRKASTASPPPEWPRPGGKTASSIFRPLPVEDGRPFSKAGSPLPKRPKTTRTLPTSPTRPPSDSSPARPSTGAANSPPKPPASTPRSRPPSHPATRTTKTPSPSDDDQPRRVEEAQGRSNEGQEGPQDHRRRASRRQPGRRSAGMNVDAATDVVIGELRSRIERAPRAITTRRHRAAESSPGTTTSPTSTAPHSANSKRPETKPPPDSTSTSRSSAMSDVGGERDRWNRRRWVRPDGTFRSAAPRRLRRGRSARSSYCATSRQAPIEMASR